MLASTLPSIISSTPSGIGLLEALSWIKELGYLNVLFESDAKGVVNALRGGKFDNSEFGVITHIAGGCWSRIEPLSEAYKTRSKSSCQCSMLVQWCVLMHQISLLISCFMIVLIFIE